MKRILLFVMLLAGMQLSAQNVQKPHKFDLRLGFGVSTLGTGDKITCNFENQLNYKISRYFSTSASVNIGLSGKGASQYTSASFVQGNLNIYISPFKNDKKNDFRIGGGFSAYRITDFDIGYSTDPRSYSYGQGLYLREIRTSFGFNVIMEYTYRISNKFLFSALLFSQPYLNGDINSGGMVKFGFVL